MKNRLTALLDFLGFPNLSSKNYAYSTCGHVWPKATAKTSGDPSYPHSAHVHCPKCGAVVDQFLKPKT
jgi:Fe2+ or Zn2+ uptake regulation protein